MNLREHHAALVRGHEDLDAALADVIGRGERRRHRRQHTIRGTVAAIVVVAGIGLVLAMRPGGPTRVTTGAGQPAPADRTTMTQLETTDHLGPAGRLRLHAPDWQTTTDDDTTSAAAGASYTVTSPEGDVLEEGTVGTHGEAIITQAPGTVVVSIARCDVSQRFEIIQGKTTTAEFPCGAKTLPTQSIPKAAGNPTDDEIRAAHRESIECMRAAGLTVNEEHLDLAPSGRIRERGVQFSIAGSGMDFDQADAVQARCEKRYLSLAFARSDYLDAHGG